MFKRFFCLFMSLILCVGAAWAGEFQDALSAYGKGDYVAAIKKFKNVAAQGDPDSQFMVGAMYSEGQGIAQDYIEAVRWFRLAAAQGYVDAQVNLGMMYNRGNGVIQDYSEAVRLYKAAAEQGDAKGQLNLGAMYALGQGVVQDEKRAHMWSNLAAATGNANAVKLRDLVASKMTTQQVAEAQKLARECQAKNFKNCD
jgi:TPR repeat protein